MDAPATSLLDLTPQMLHALYQVSRQLARSQSVTQIERTLVTGLGEVVHCTGVVWYTLVETEEGGYLAYGDSVGAPDVLMRDQHMMHDQIVRWRVPLVEDARVIPVATLLNRHHDHLAAFEGCGALITGEKKVYALVVVLWSTHIQRPTGWQQALVSLAEECGYGLDRLSAKLGLATFILDQMDHFTTIRAEQERTRAVIDATNDAILMIDEHRRPILINRRARFFFGVKERELIGKSFEQLSRFLAQIFEQSTTFNDWLLQLLGSQTARDVREFALHSPERRLLQCFSAPVTDVHDHYRGRILIFRDITREREVERMKNDFVSTVSHELRTPLTSIQGSLQLVLGKPGNTRSASASELSPRNLELLTISLANTERLIRLINDILDLAKIEQGRIQLRREPIRPEELCQSAVRDMHALAATKQIRLEVVATPGLPAVMADRDRSIQVLINLLSNAIKFSPAGGRVLLRVQRYENVVCFAVQDWGRGIPPEHHERVFQRFQQLDSSSTREFSGTGLGLAISKTLVEEQGGSIWLESAAGQGATFHFTVPIVPGSEGLAFSSGESIQARHSHILVVEDDPYVRPVLIRLLQRYGLQVTHANDGFEALAAINSLQPDLVLLDIKMPGIDGLEVLYRMHQHPEMAHIPVIILTADDLNEHTRARGMALGARAYLEKPIGSERLINTINRVLAAEEQG
ncbi:ATP-binding protein [Candidatus Chloroploca sp. Khr17]|uniref:hybrid sensor histidine kinase/response regulator n=1 Tax=Candidatus Chloroploca sp. Khr17 TaxID=2496869 RepID=UPI00101D69E0|nr:ATP-binding protein [Candidatus Chloroploca sp. Khr17]